MASKSFTLSNELEMELIKLAKEKDRPESYIIRKALEHYIQEQKDIKTALKAFDQYYQSGQQKYSLTDIVKEYEL